MEAATILTRGAPDHLLDQVDGRPNSHPDGETGRRQFVGVVDEIIRLVGLFPLQYVFAFDFDPPIDSAH